jgi:hypothetical protein
VDQFPAASQPLVQPDRNTACTAIAAATMDSIIKAKSFTDWTNYARESRGADPWLRGYSKALKQEYLLSFATQV